MGRTKTTSGRCGLMWINGDFISKELVSAEAMIISSPGCQAPTQRHLSSAEHARRASSGSPGSVGTPGCFVGLEMLMITEVFRA